jgi:hypothetical protein
MDKHALLAAVAQIMPLCNKPEQLAFLNSLSEAPPEAFESIIKSIASTVNPNDIGTLVESEFAHLDNNTRENIKQQALGAYNFLSNK